MTKKIIRTLTVVFAIVALFLALGCGKIKKSASGGGDEIAVDETSPSDPADIMAVNFRETGFDIFWTASEDDNDVYYIIYGDSGVGTSVTELGRTTNTNFIDLRVKTPNSRYLYRIRAFDKAGNYSGLVETFLTMLPASPKDTKATSVTNKKFIVTWTNPLENYGAGALGYVYIEGQLKSPQEGLTQTFFEFTPEKSLETYTVWVMMKREGDGVESLPATVEATTASDEIKLYIACKGSNRIDVVYPERGFNVAKNIYPNGDVGTVAVDSILFKGYIAKRKSLDRFSTATDELEETVIWCDEFSRIDIVEVNPSVEVYTALRSFSSGSWRNYLIVLNGENTTEIPIESGYNLNGGKEITNLLFYPDGNKLYVFTNSGKIYVVDVDPQSSDRYSVINQIDIGSLWSLGAVINNGRMYIADIFGYRIIVLKLLTMEIMDEEKIVFSDHSVMPDGIVFHLDYMYVTDAYNDEVLKINPVDKFPQALGVGNIPALLGHSLLRNELYVPNFSSRSCTVINIDDFTVQRIFTVGYKPVNVSVHAPKK